MRDCVSLSSVATCLLLPLSAWAQFTEPERAGIESGQTRVDWAPTLSNDLLEVYFTSWITGGDWDIWSARREDIDSPWEEFQPLDVVNSHRHEDSANLSPDGLTLTFASDGLEGGFGNYDLWQTTRVSRDAPWLEPENLGPVINSRGGEGSATFSPDGLELIFDRGCCETSWLRRSTRRTLADPWSEPESMSPRGSEHEFGAAGFPSLSPDGLSLFFNQQGEYGGEDICVSRRPAPDAPFGPAENLGSSINTSGRDMMPRIASDGSLYYVYSAITNQAPWEIWRAGAETPLVPRMLQAGDADQDLDFDQLDIVLVAQTGKYLTGDAATWGEGDWNGAPGGLPGTPPPGDGLFDQFDIVLALAGSKYLQGPYAAQSRPSEELLFNDLIVIGSFSGSGERSDMDLIHVPEPSPILLAVIGFAGLLTHRWRWNA